MELFHNMYLPVAKFSHFLDIHHILGWKPAIEHIPSNEEHGYLNQLLGRIVHGSQRKIPIVFLHNILKESVHKKGDEQENVAHINRSNPCRKPFMLLQMLKNTRQVRGHLHQNVELAPQPNNKYVKYAKYAKYLNSCIYCYIEHIKYIAHFV